MIPPQQNLMKKKIAEKCVEKFGASIFMQHFEHRFEPIRLIFINKNNALCHKNLHFSFILSFWKINLVKKILLEKYSNLN